MNPFKMRPERTGDLFVDWEKFWVKPYNKNEVKIRIQGRESY